MTLPPQPASRSDAATRACRGFTLIELLVVLAIVAIVVTAGVPGFQDFIREQRVRSIASDMVSDFALARSEAARFSARVFVARAGFAGCTIPGIAWNEGWCVFVDINGDDTADAGEILRVQQAVGGNLRICSAAADLADVVVFGPRGQVVRNGAVDPDDGMVITDDSTGAANARTRILEFGLVGRVTTVNQNNVAPPC